MKSNKNKSKKLKKEDQSENQEQEALNENNLTASISQTTSNNNSEKENDDSEPSKKVKFNIDQDKNDIKLQEESEGKEEQEEEEEDDEVATFAEMGIDDRILMSILNLGWLEPTPIQESAIPLILEGKDILAKARTGSGKTGAYAIPLLHKILSMKKLKSSKQSISCLILTPSRELCSQAHKNLLELMLYCQREIQLLDLSSNKMNFQQQKQTLLTKPDIIISTPTQILNHLKDQTNSSDIKQTLEMLIIDEADLLLSFGYEEEMKKLVQYLPKNVQTILLSATLNDEVQTVKSLYLHNPAILKLKESAELPDPIQLEQYLINCNEEEDKFVLLYSIMKLQLIKGKSLIFVNTVNRCYKLKLFLENFGIRSCALNSELPLNSRMHIIEQFNGGIYDTIIASDEKFLDNYEQEADNNKTPSKRKKDKEYNISRGIDFRNVANVINFDFPVTTKSYIHRVGRTARGNNQGTALSFVDKSEQDLLLLVEDDLKESYNYYKSSSKSSDTAATIFKPFRFKMDEIEGFRYRARDVLRSITTVCIKEARIKEIKNELLNSEKLKSYFEENPREEQMLRHDKELNLTKLDEHLRNVPDYIIPPSLRGIQFNKNSKSSNKGHNNNKRKRLTSAQIKFKKKNADPLRSFNFAGLKSKKSSNKSKDKK